MQIVRLSLRLNSRCPGLLRRTATVLSLIMALGAVGRAAQQPISFPHNTHMQLGLQCIDCHMGADIRDTAGLPSVRKCMLCHAKLARQKPEVQKVIGYANKNLEIPWIRVYDFSPDAHVKFRHAPHFQAGVPCSRCHGDLTKATVATEAVRHNMGTCLTCHRQMQASQDCTACHF
jgi:hypothetical protein